MESLEEKRRKTRKTMSHAHKPTQSQLRELIEKEAYDLHLKDKRKSAFDNWLEAERRVKNKSKVNRN